MNTINRHNYEEFFLLYVDDELNNQQRKKVELFVEQNADLASELKKLQQTKFFPENKFVFTDKNILLKKTEPEINISNYEEYFLLYFDNELNQTEKQAVEKFLLQHRQFQNEFNLLQQTVLPLEKMEFIDKSVLLKEEKEPKKIMPVNWLKLSAAAAFIGLIAFSWFKISSNKLPTVTVATHQQTINANKNNAVIAPQKPEIKNNQPNKNSTAAVQPTDSINKGLSVNTVKKNHTMKNNIAVNNQPNISAKPQAEIKKETNELPVQQHDVTSTDAHKNTSIDFSALHPLQEIDAEKIKKDEANYAADMRETLAQQASYHELNTSDDDARTLYVGTMQINKDKVRGLLKKASRVFGGKAKDIGNDNGKLQVANLEINTQKL
ncbi:MAG: hypothetical protein ACR2FN_04075 [Chitinophagaceae bacterium]